MLSHRLFRPILSCDICTAIFSDVFSHTTCNMFCHVLRDYSNIYLAYFPTVWLNTLCLLYSALCLTKICRTSWHRIYTIFCSSWQVCFGERWKEDGNYHTGLDPKVQHIACQESHTSSVPLRNELNTNTEIHLC